MIHRKHRDPVKIICCKHGCYGYLGVRFNNYITKFRTNEAWNAALNSTVLIHYTENENSYIVPIISTISVLGLAVCLVPRNMSVYGSGISIRVNNIDPVNRLASIQLSRTPAQLMVIF